jgi:hypothetical protein
LHGYYADSENIKIRQATDTIEGKINPEASTFLSLMEKGSIQGHFH